MVRGFPIGNAALIAREPEGWRGRTWPSPRQRESTTVSILWFREKAVRGEEVDGRGDLHVLFMLPTILLFTRKGDNFFVCPITFTEAALGCRVKVPTMDGSVKVRVPAGVGVDKNCVYRTAVHP